METQKVGHGIGLKREKRNNRMQKQIGGNHYQQFPFQPKDLAHRMDLGFFQGNVIKYVCRYKFKNGLQDLEKALDYAEELQKYYNEGIGKDYDGSKMDNPTLFSFFHANVGLLDIKQRQVILAVVANSYDDTIKFIKQLIDEHPNINKA